MTRDALVAPPEDRWGPAAPPLLRGVTALAWLSLVARLVASALPGSRSGIEPWIHRADVVSSLLTQLSALLGAGLLVLLVVTTVADRSFRYVYRVVVVPAAAVVLMLVMLASTAGLDAPAAVFLGVACLVLAAASAGTALGAAASRAQGLVICWIALAAACRLAVRATGFGSGLPADGSWVARASWVLAGAGAFDAIALVLAATRLVAERRRHARYALVGVLAATTLLAWGARRGSLEDAGTWQVIVARGLADLGSGPGPFASSFTLDACTVLLAGAVAAWPGRLSTGMVSVGLALLSRPGVDVPASALLLALGALASPLGSPPETVLVGPRRESAAGADG